MANGISKNPLTDIGKVYLTQIAEGSLKNLEKASVLAMSDDPKDQDKAREIKTRFDYQSLMKQKKAKKMKEDIEFTEARSDWRSDLREIISADEASDEPEIKEKKIKNKITINPQFKEAVEEMGGKLLTVEEVEEDPKKAEQMKKKEKMLKKRMLMMKMRAVQQGAGDDVVAGYEPEGDMVEAKYEAGASTYGKASIRNKRRFGTKGENPDPLTGKKITKDATRGELIAKRREEHKAKRGVKEEVGVTTSMMMDKAKKEAMLRKKEQDAVAKKMKKEEITTLQDANGNDFVQVIDVISSKKVMSDWRNELSEDDMKGMSVKSGHKRPTKSGAGMTQKGVEAYRRKNPGSKLKTAVTTEPSKLKKGSKDANRRKSYCARSAGQMKKFPKAAKDPNSRLRQARRRWNC